MLDYFDQLGFYSRLARRLRMSREFTKRTFYLHCYGGELDPWLEYLMRVECKALVEEMKLTQEI